MKTLSKKLNDEQYQLLRDFMDKAKVLYEKYENMSRGVNFSKEIFKDRVGEPTPSWVADIEKFNDALGRIRVAISRVTDIEVEKNKISLLYTEADSDEEIKKIIFGTLYAFVINISYAEGCIRQYVDMNDLTTDLGTLREYAKRMIEIIMFL